MFQDGILLPNAFLGSVVTDFQLDGTTEQEPSIILLISAEIIPQIGLIPHRVRCKMR